MQKIHNKNLVSNAKKLRKNMTKEERHLWYDYLRDYPVKFLRQKPFGNYIIDFYCEKAKIAIELDGSQHFTEQNIINNDNQRDTYLKKYNITFIRIPNNEINNNFAGVCEYIDLSVKKSLSVQSLSQQS
ncbi:MAG: endonuclease domain-containing protein [Ruminococcaceae bacterium]|nr:endonuclease domain-containing protein [Oscillospiraceae bacterium]